jgi:predicted O-methyltransferase YrrM
MTCEAHALAASRGMLCSDDVDLIRLAVGRLPADQDVVVVDLGAGSGTTALSVFAERSERIRVWTVDHHADALNWAGLAVSNAGFLRLWSPLLLESANAVQLTAPIDLLLIDADHTHPALRADFMAWRPQLRPGALIWCHDYTEDYPGVKQAIEELKAGGAVVELGRAGWGWLGQIPPEPLPTPAVAVEDSDTAKPQRRRAASK